MRKLMTVVMFAAVLAVPSFAGVTRFAAKESYKGAKKAGHAGVAMLKFGKKVLF